MATTYPSSADVAEAFRTFPFAMDQEYQVSDICGSALPYSLSPWKIAEGLDHFFYSQTGLQSILSSDAFDSKSNTEKEITLRMSRVFYFNKYVEMMPFTLAFLLLFLIAWKLSRVTGNSVTLEDALSFESPTRLVDSNRLAVQQQQQQAVGEEAGILTFAELKALIEQGKTEGIPNNRLIPNTLNVRPHPPKLLLHHPRPKPRAL